MRKSVLSAAALAAMTSVAMAEPRKLGDKEMVEVTAGLYDVVFIVPVTVIYNTMNSTAVGAGTGSAASNAESDIAVNNIIGVNKSGDVIGALRPASGVFAGGWWPSVDLRTGSGGGDGVSPLRAWSMITGMLRSRYFGRGW